MRKKVIGKLAIGLGVLGAIAFHVAGRVVLFWMAIACVVGLVVSFWLLVSFARSGFLARLGKLRERLLLSRTLEKRMRGDKTVSPVEADDVDVLLARIRRGTLNEVPIWAVCDIYEIDAFRTLVESFPDGLDPDAQPTWLCLLNGVFLFACIACALVGGFLWVKGWR